MSVAEDVPPVLEASTPARPLRLVVFGFDAAEAAQIRRFRSYLDAGYAVTGFTMRRRNMNRDFEPFWDNVHLFTTENESMLRRIGAILGAMAKLLGHRDKLRGADAIVARNLDMLMVAAFGRLLAGRQAVLIYECLDIHGFMTHAGLKGRVFRWVERRLLGLSGGLIVSSPAFLREYFEPVQGWRGPSVLIENKVWVGEDGPKRPSAPAAPLPARAFNAVRPLRLGWVGTLRCDRSLKLLAAAAERLGPRLALEFHGVVHGHAVPEFEAIVAAHSNITYHGPYEYPGGLGPVYAGCDLVWAQDLWQWGQNSTWLLPNRIYEAGYFGCPSLAVAGSETGRRVADGFGWTIPAPEPDALVAFLEGLTPQAVEETRRAVLAMPVGAVRQSVGEIRAAIEGPVARHTGKRLG